MLKYDFLDKCKSVGVEAIEPIENDHDNGFKVVLKDGSCVYVIFREEYGDAWMEYETGEHFEERWRNTKILTDEESEEFFKKTLDSIKQKYSDPYFKLFMEALMPEKNITPTND